MRKSLIVFGTMAALIAGAVAGHSALAQEPPGDLPFVPGFIEPQLPDFPGFGGDLGPQDVAGDPPATLAADPADGDPADGDPADGDPADGDPAGGDSAGGHPAGGHPVEVPPAVADRPDQAPSRAPGADQPPRPAGPAAAPHRPGAAAEPPGDDRPQRSERPDGERERPHPQRAFGFAHQQADPVAAARARVTRSSVSASPAAPVQQQVLALVNQERRRAGCAGVTVDRRLIEAANRHAADMARHGYFDHRDPRGDRAGERVRDAGYRWSRFGENIARGQDSPYEVVDGWMHSPQHRENILDCELDQMGVGLAFARDETPYWVQNFATPQ